jgi:RNA polymerase sigma-70 factor (family 1)
MRQESKEIEFQQLYTENFSRLYYAALYILRDEETAKDLINDVFADLWEDFNWQDKTINYTYLYKNVHNKCIDYLRHSNVENRFITLSEALGDEAYETNIDSDEQNERLEIINKTLDELPQRTKFVIEQCFYNGKKYTEVADMMNITTSGVNKHVMKALTIIRNKFSIKYKKGVTKTNNVKLGEEKDGE